MTALECVRYLNIAGIVLSVVGVIVLFKFAMPYRLRMGGGTVIVADQRDEAEHRLEQRYDVLSLLGLGLVIVGAILQIIATLAE